MLRNAAVAIGSVLLITAFLQSAEKIDFAHDVMPILKAKCAECHTNGKYKGGLSLDTREAMLKAKAVVLGKSADSAIIDRVTDKEPKTRMPPKGPPLTEKEVAVLKTWIDQGTSWEAGFSFLKAAYVPPLKPRRPTLPAGGDSDNPIDRIIGAYLSERKLPPLEPVDDITFLHRVTLDLAGLLPTPEVVDAYLADASSDRRQHVIRRLLDNRLAYAEHWLTFWNDLLRNDYAGTGYIDGGRKSISQWLYRALLDNKPYDQFVRELISPTAESEGFIKGIKWRGVVNASQVPEIQFAQNVSQVFLGINMKCTSCHDSFIDRWKLDDAYALAAVIADQPPEIHRCDKPTGKHATARFLFPELGTLDASKPRNERLRQFADLMVHPDNGRLARTVVNRLWQRLMGRGIVHPVDVMSNEPWNADLLDYLATHLADNGYDLKKTLALIASSRAYQARSVAIPEDVPASDYVFRGPITRRLTAEQFLDAVWRITQTAPANPAFSAGDRGKEAVRASLVVSDALMRSLGRPNREQVVSTRPDELSTLQALDLTNGPVLAGILDRGAKNLRRGHPRWNADEATAGIYLAALNRQPTAEELATARELLGASPTDDGLADLLWAVFMLPEFQIIR